MKFKSFISVFSALTIAVSAVSGDWAGITAKAYEAEAEVIKQISDDIIFSDNTVVAADDTLAVYDAGLSFDASTNTVTWNHYNGSAANGMTTNELFYEFHFNGTGTDIGHRNTSDKPSRDNFHSLFAYLKLTQGQIYSGNVEVTLKVRVLSDNNEWTYIAESSDNFIYSFDGCDEKESINTPQNVRVETQYGNEGIITWDIDDNKSVTSYVFMAKSQNINDAVTGLHYYKDFCDDSGHVKDLVDRGFDTDFYISIYAIDKNADYSAPYTCKYSDLFKVNDLTAATGTSSVTLSWSDISGAETYRIRRHDGKNWSNYDEVTEAGYTDTNVTAGTTYKYAVYTFNGGAWSPASNIVSAKTAAAAPAAPANVKATAGTGKVTLTWSAVSGATKYRVRRNDGSGWVNYKETSSTSLTDTDVTNDTKYYYAVYAYNGKWSAASSIVNATPTGSVIAQNVKATAGTGKITLTWNAVSGATKYRIRRNDGSGWVNYKDVTATSLTDTSVTAGTTYKYAVYSYVGGKWGGASAIVSAKPAAAAPVVTGLVAKASVSRVYLDWNAYAGATKYRIRRNDGTGWVNYQDLNVTNYNPAHYYIDDNVINGTAYKYAIYAYVNGAWTSASQIASATPFYSTVPQDVSIKTSSGKITISWRLVANATKYRIRRNDGTGWVNYKDRTTVASTDTSMIYSYNDSSVTSGTTYSYAVYAYVNGVWSGASAIVSATAK